MTSSEPGVQLPSETSASGLLHRLVRGATQHFDDLADVEIPEDPAAFKKRFATLLPRFEAARLASDQRSAIARRIALEAGSSLVYRDTTGSDRDLAEVLGDAKERGKPLELVRRPGTIDRPLRIAIPCEGETHRGDGVVAFIDRLEGEHSITRTAGEGLRWIAEHGVDGLDLRGQKFVLLGAGAELAPTSLLLAAGAEVLWVDVEEPELDPAQYRGVVHYVAGGADLLTQPREILATIEAFAGDDTVSVGMFAYAAGQGREWRLEAAMNAITNALPRDRVAAVGLYISPTSVARVSAPDVTEVDRRRAVAPAWQKLLAKTGTLARSLEVRSDVRVSRAIVPLQGASYQATQYIAKALAAEAFATSRRVPVVSANVAGITNTSSMSLSVFQASFIGAKLFGVRIFEPATTRWLSGLLLMHDWLNPDVVSDDPQRLFERQIHGGVYAMAYALDDAIRYAAVYGFARRPSLVAAMARGR